MPTLIAFENDAYRKFETRREANASGPVANAIAPAFTQRWLYDLHGAFRSECHPIILSPSLRSSNSARADFKGRHYEATLIVQAVSCYLR